ncbi:26S proteasome non-ATPase regulatory subunit 10-like [Cimex lectularius]|uniref:26S proteasome non-ATPase regulatory subunit 10 n=1 Tax=Cimex lectularius TaxID=79782 RepID=A0A8I6RP42_CIMLE|nr:26S proteasome non-ATPase regulatory subunit 10-like [Cimex lectularius]
MSADEQNKIFNEAYSGNFEYVKMKIEEDPALTTKLDSNGRHLLHWSVLSGKLELVQYLLDKGSPVNHPDDIGMTPLILGASAGKVQVCHLLISKGATINAKSDEGHSALQYAASKGWNDIVKMLLINHADINIADKRGARPVHRAASQGKTAVLKILLDFGNQIQIDATDVYGNTALHLSCEENREEESKLLVMHGAKLDIKNKEGHTPLDLAPLQLAKTLRNISSRS